MLKMFTKDVRKADGSIRWHKGEISSDYPSMTWTDIAKSVGEPLEKFTKPVDNSLLTKLGVAETAAATPAPAMQASSDEGDLPAPSVESQDETRKKPRRRVLEN